MHERKYLHYNIIDLKMGNGWENAKKKVSVKTCTNLKELGVICSSRGILLPKVVKGWE